jgi:hypothetical protein
VLLKLLHKTEKERMLLNSLYKVLHSYQNWKRHNKNRKKKLSTNFLDENRYKKFSIKYMQTEFNSILKKSYTIIILVSFQGCKDSSTCA